jgi:hypothetical protein
MAVPDVFTDDMFVVRRFVGNSRARDGAVRRQHRWQLLEVRRVQVEIYSCYAHDFVLLSAIHQIAKCDNMTPSFLYHLPCASEGWILGFFYKPKLKIETAVYASFDAIRRPATQHLQASNKVHLTGYMAQISPRFLHLRRC